MAQKRDLQTRRERCFLAASAQHYKVFFLPGRHFPGELSCQQDCVVVLPFPLNYAFSQSRYHLTDGASRQSLLLRYMVRRRKDRGKRLSKERPGKKSSQEGATASHYPEVKLLCWCSI